MSTCFNPFSLDSKTILVTGASSGIGRQIAIDCSKMGATVIITGRNAERLKDTYDNLSGENHSLIVSDLSNIEGINLLLSSISVLDGVALCAGRGFSCPVQFSTSEKMQSVFEINFFSTAEILRLLYKSKKLKKNSSAVIIDSVGGITRFSPGGSIYGVTKAALNSFMKFCAREFGQRKVRVNCICPGMVETPLIHRGKITEEQLKADMARYPLGRYGEPTDISNGAIYLLSDASSWVTGTSLFIDGGVSII